MSTTSDAATPRNPIRLHVRAGQLASDESWVYAWFSGVDRAVVYVGATGLQPAVRTWLHLNSAEPDLGRVAARLPQARDEDFEVLAVQVPASESRAQVRDELVEALEGEGLLSKRYAGLRPDAEPESRRADAFNPVVVSMVEAIRHHLTESAQV